MAEILIAQGLADILDNEILRWGCIRSAFLHWTEEDEGNHLISVIIDTSQDSLFERDFHHCRGRHGVAVEVPEYVLGMIDKITAATGWSKQDSGTLLFDTLRTLIKTSEDLGYDY